MAVIDAPHPRDLTDEQWNFIGPFLPELARRKDGRGRPWRENRAVLNGILWILRTGAPWADVPDRYPLYQTCHRRFQQWVRVGVLRSILEILAQALHDQGYLDLQEAFIDGSFAPAKQGGACVGKTKRGKGSKIMAIADRQGSSSSSGLVRDYGVGNQSSAGFANSDLAVLGPDAWRQHRSALSNCRTNAREPGRPPSVAGQPFSVLPHPCARMA
jgi:transposase